MFEPLRVRWDRTVIHSTEPGDDTIVCCLDQHGHPVALFLDDELREALGLQLLLPDGDGEVDPQHLELARENERLRAEVERLAAMRVAARDVLYDYADGKATAEQAAWRVAAALAHAAETPATTPTAPTA